ncbi:MAG TPA: cell envelope integrity protein TolA [Acidiferrobacterales bacterium]|jgi:colicin import membrane protein
MVNDNPGQRAGRRKSAGGYRAVVYAVLVHLVVLALLVVSFRFTSQPEPPQVMQARVVEDDGARKEVERLRREQEAKIQEELKRQEQLKRQEELKAQQTQRETAEAEKQRQAAETEAKRAAEQKRKQEEERKRQAAEAEKKRQAEAQRKQEAERRQEAESALKQQLAAEEQELAQARAQTEIARYEALIRQKVERNWARPPGAPQGMECRVRVRLVASGEVLQATVVQSSGNAAFDRSVENAVYKASPLPIPDDKTLFDYFRELEFKFRPEG